MVLLLSVVESRIRYLPAVVSFYDAAGPYIEPHSFLCVLCLHVAIAISVFLLPAYLQHVKLTAPTIYRSCAFVWHEEKQCSLPSYVATANPTPTASPRTPLLTNCVQWRTGLCVVRPRSASRPLDDAQSLH